MAAPGVDETGAVSNGWVHYERALQCIKEEVNECTEFFDGTCWERPAPGRGHILWDNERAQCSDSVILVPGFNLMHRGVLIVAYALFLVWLFFGIAISSDIFSEAIENITSLTKKVKKKHPRTGEIVEVEEKVWNWVVANISLMAFGTSAPEILLSIVETLTQLGSKTGNLGASTIIGSAAYNFFLIPGICSAALAPGEFKRLAHVWVFVCTAIWSVWAYIWFFLVLGIISPNEVEIWEGFVTLAFFPLMLITAYTVDKKPWLWLSRSGRVSDSFPFDIEENVEKEDDDLTPPLPDPGNESIKANGSLKSAHANGSLEKGGDVWGPSPGVTGSLEVTSSSHGPSLAPKQKHSILHYRMLTMRQLAGESKTPEMLAYARERGGEMHDEVNTLSGRFVERAEREQAAPEGSTKLGFGSLHYSVLEAQGAARVVVRRYDGDLDMPISVSFSTKDGTAIAGLDYKPVQGELKFGPGEVEKEIEVSIIDDDMSEPDVTFNVVLKEVRGLGVVIVQDSVPVTIVDDDDGGMLMFELPTKEVPISESYVELPVVRKNGADGRVTVEFSTKDGTGPAAIAGQHYKETKGTLVFEPGDTRAFIRVPLIAIGNNNMLVFKAELANPLGGAVLGKRTVCRVIIIPGRSKLSKSKSLGSSKSGGEKGDGGDDDDDDDDEEFSLWEGYKEQYKEAIMPELEEGADNVWFDMLLHYISISWKVMCVPIPPPEYGGGYPAFVGSLVILVGIIFLTKEVANLLGCELTLSQTMTGLSLVTLGTSLPDTFASRMAAMHDDTADAAIGNITGSNSTNVFLGLGLPWIIASGYYYGRGEKYVVPAGDLGFTLVLWCAGFGAMSIVLFIRRLQGGELGGSLVMQRVLMAWSMFLWIFFLVLSGVHDYNHFESGVTAGSN